MVICEVRMILVCVSTFQQEIMAPKEDDKKKKTGGQKDALVVQLEEEEEEMDYIENAPMPTGNSWASIAFCGLGILMLFLVFVACIFLAFIFLTSKFSLVLS